MKKAARLAMAVVVLAASAACADSQASGGPVSGLPHAGGRQFASLDDYLAFLKQRGAMDIPWYELQPDGRYLYIRGRGSANNPQYFTRRQLLEKFGFSE